MTLGLRSLVVTLCMEITLKLYVSFLFVIVTYFLLRCNYVICLFDVVTFSDDVRIRLFFDTFQLCTELRYNIAIF